MVPTEKDDLVEHLKYWAFKFCGRGDKENIASDVMTEAWEEIERLREALQKIAAVDDEKLPTPVTQAEGVLWSTLGACVDLARKALGEKE
jgi:hypothetical protein